MVRRLTVVMPANLMLAYKNSLMSKDICSKSRHLPRTANERATVACVERALERVEPEINTPMDRLTNLYNSTVGSEVPRVEIRVQSVSWYIIQHTPNCLKQPATSGRIEEGPKGGKRHNKLEFGIVRREESLGRRRIHSTRWEGI